METLIIMFGLVLIITVFWMAVKLTVIGIATAVVAAIWVILIAVFLYCFWRLF